MDRTALGCLGIHSGVSKHPCSQPSGKYLQVLSFLFTLRLPGSVQIWRNQRHLDGNLAGAAL